MGMESILFHHCCALSVQGRRGEMDILSPPGQKAGTDLTISKKPKEGLLGMDFTLGKVSKVHFDSFF